MRPNESAQVERFRFIDFLLLFKGSFIRYELVRRFGIGQATASRTIANFLQAFPDLVDYLGTRRGYIAKQGYISPFEHSAEDGLNYVMSGIIYQTIDTETYGTPFYSMHPSLETPLTAIITRSMARGGEAHIQYASASSGIKSRTVAPHTIFRAGGAWYFRAYDYDSYEFRSFKFSRIKSAVELNTINADKVKKDKDNEWNRIRIVKLAPHPKNPLPDAQMSDLGIKDSEEKEIMVSEALLGFVLTDLRVDCSKEYSLNFRQYPLVLKNKDELMNIGSMRLAPGFR